MKKTITVKFKKVRYGKDKTAIAYWGAMCYLTCPYCNRMIIQTLPEEKKALRKWKKQKALKK